MTFGKVWCRKTLRIPRSGASTPVEAVSDEVIQAANESHKVSTLKRLTDCEEDRLLREQLRRNDGDFSKTLQFVERVMNFCRIRDASTKEMLAWLELHDHDVDRALEEYEKGRKWESHSDARTEKKQL
eukprot:Polyplicarium_translucidae@DN1052_c0_g1_i1.p1